MNMQEELVALTQRLVEFRSIPGDLVAIQACEDFIEQWAASHKLHSARHMKDGFPSLVLSNRPVEKHSDVILHGHIDVVEADEGDFTPRVEGNKLFGRGSLDMKGGVACLMWALAHSRTDASVNLLITPDEETGSLNGAAYLLEREKYRAEFFLSAEGEKDYLLKVKQKGVVKFNLDAKGGADHSAYTWMAPNAVRELMKCYLAIERMFPENLTDPDHWYTTINIGHIHGGKFAGAIASDAHAECDIRFCDDWGTTEKVIGALEQVVAQYPAVSLSVPMKTEMTNSDASHPHLVRLNAIFKNTLGWTKDLFWKNHGTNDARFGSWVGIPSVAVGPTGDNYHVPDEFVYIDSLVNFTTVIREFLQEFTPASAR